MTFDLLSPVDLKLLEEVGSGRGRLASASECEKKLIFLDYLRPAAGIVSITKAGKRRLANERSLRKPA